MNAKVHILVSGRVQGVYYRHNTLQQAQALGLTGWVRNRPDGLVEILCEGDRQALDRMIEWCRKGPPGALVEQVDFAWGDYTDEHKTFQIIR